MGRDVESWLTSCRVCPRQCGANRAEGTLGFCGEGAHLRVASIEAHFGEEPPISGEHGSGTVFFSGCTLQCDFCQNYQISRSHIGTIMTVAEVVQRLTDLSVARRIHNVNFVTPDHFLPHTIEIVQLLRARGIDLPIVYNLSGYERQETLHALEGYADIYLPDFKYADTRLGERLSHCRDYPSIALDAIAEMIRQQGILDVARSEHLTGTALRGVLVRHLILPGYIQNSLDALSMLFLEFGNTLPLSLMSQYSPVTPCPDPQLRRRITDEEFSLVYTHALELGFQTLFVQYPSDHALSSSEFLPDFSQSQPFKGNRRTA
ncbi:radical SAM protein [candidate division KSB3 bacterium]|uniref:Radical SAM protein n=1 Tax=candidate division KSB3 bacterium TaxID=2044937 RepID=A0A9D5Q6I7_9BACT|nr:radical SAM protein [candidate division KSB3 bacterium]MBD3325287.1 radical SAM protein [candidate division KSB3 bacterium]